MSKRDLYIDQRGVVVYTLRDNGGCDGCVYYDMRAEHQDANSFCRKVAPAEHVEKMRFIYCIEEGRIYKELVNNDS